MSKSVIRTPSRGIHVGKLRMTGYLIPADRVLPTPDMQPYTPEDLRVYRCECCGNNIAILWAKVRYLAEKLAPHKVTGRHPANRANAGCPTQHSDNTAAMYRSIDLRCGIAHTNPAKRTIATCLSYDKDVTDGLADDKGKLWTYLPLTNPPKGHEPSPVLADEKWCPTCEGTGLIDRDHPTDRQKIDMIDAKLAKLWAASNTFITTGETP